MPRMYDFPVLNSFKTNIEEILRRQKLLQKEISSVQEDAAGLLSAAANNSLRLSDGLPIPQRVIAEHFRVSEELAGEIQPIRLEHAKLKRKLENIQDKWLAITEARDMGLDSVEICLENQVSPQRRKAPNSYF